MESNKASYDHLQRLYSPRTTYKNILEADEMLLREIMLNFDPFAINVLKAEWAKYNDSLSQKQLVQLMFQHLGRWQLDLPDRERWIMRSLTLLANTLDSNLNGKIQWAEFASYIAQKATIINRTKKPQEEIKSYSKTNFKVVSVGKRPYKFDSLLQKMVWIPTLRLLATCADHGDTIYLVSPDTGELESKCIKVQPKPQIVKTSIVKSDNEGGYQVQQQDNIIYSKTAILDMIYIPERKYDIIVTSTSDRYVRGWCQSSNGWIIAHQPDNEEETLEHQFQREIYSLAWDNMAEILYCGCKEGTISMWKLKTDTETMFDVSEGHTSLITVMIAMPKLKFLASASLDAQLILWDTISDRRKRVFTEHDRGILALAFNELLILLFSAGFDHKICVWNPYVDKLVHKVTGFSAPILVLNVLNSTNQIVSLSGDGSVRVMEMFRLNTAQSFSLEAVDAKHKFNAQAFTFIQQPTSIAFCGAGLQLWRYNKDYQPKAVDDDLCPSCFYDPKSLQFFTPVGRRLKVWSALTGEVKKVIMDVIPAEITAACTDACGKRLLLGDKNGNVVLLNIQNGAKFKQLQGHIGEVIQTIYTAESKNFITAGLDHTIIISKDLDLDNVEYTRTIKLQDLRITALNYASDLNFLLVGTSTGITALYEIDTGKLHGSHGEMNRSEEITSILPMKDLSYMITTTNQGQINVVALPPFLFKLTKMFSYTNYDQEGKKEPSGIQTGFYQSIRHYLYIGDESGHIRAYNFEQIDNILVTSLAQSVTQAGKSSVKFIDPPSFVGVMPPPLLWSVDAHTEPFYCLNYVQSDDWLISVSRDRMIKLWNAKTGQYLESLQQDSSKSQPRPVAYRQPGTKITYNAETGERIDLDIDEDDIEAEDNDITFKSQVSRGSRKDLMAEAKSSASIGPTIVVRTDDDYHPRGWLSSVKKSAISNPISNAHWKLQANYMQSWFTNEQEIKASVEKRRSLPQMIAKQPLQHHSDIVSFLQNNETVQKFDRENKPIVKEAEILRREGNQQKHDKDVFEENLRKIAIKSSKISTTQKLRSDVSTTQPKFERKTTGQTLLSRMGISITLTKPELDAAHRLADALEYYCPGDRRLQVFREIDEKNIK